MNLLTAILLLLLILWLSFSMMEICRALVLVRALRLEYTNPTL